MRILVLPKNLLIGGTQINAADLAASQAERGHDVHVGSERGPLVAQLQTSGVAVWELPTTDSRMTRLRQLRKLVRKLRPDVIHAFEIRNILVSRFVVPGTPILGTIMSTRVPWFLPETLPLTVGMPALEHFTNRWRTGRTVLVLPPISVEVSGVQDQRTRLCASLGIAEPAHLVAMVIRLVAPFKRESILRSIASVGRIARDLDVVLLIVGDGPARAEYEKAGADTNARVGRQVVVFAGEMDDPTEVFEAADVVIGSGTSAMRAVALGIPTVVVGREGFSAVVDVDVLEDLIEDGFYGVGEGLGEIDLLDRQITDSIRDPVDQIAARETVVSRYGSPAVAARLEHELESAILASPVRRVLAELVRALVRIGLYRVRRARLRRIAIGRGLEAEQADNYVYGALRNLALPPSSFGTGRNRTSESDLPADPT